MLLALFLVAASGSSSLVAGLRLFTAVASLVAALRTRASGAEARWGISCGSWALEQRFPSWGCTGLLVLRHVGSSQATDQHRCPALAAGSLPLSHQGSPVHHLSQGREPHCLGRPSCWVLWVCVHLSFAHGSPSAARSGRWGS